MDIAQIRKGMVVECSQGVGTVLAVDRETQSVLLEKQDTHEQLAVDAGEIEFNPQLHTGCERYY